MSFRNVSRPRAVDIVLGVYGVLYRASWFDVGQLKHDAALFPGNDDIILSAALQKKGVERVVVPFAHGETVQAQTQASAVDALWWGDNKHSRKNDNAVRSMGLYRFWSSLPGRILTMRNPLLHPSQGRRA
jgi:hypothetical protein